MDIKSGMIKSLRNCIIRSKFIDPFMNVALGSYITKQYSGGNIMMLSSCHHAVMIGRNQNYMAECNLGAMIRDNVPLIRRESGGGACYVDKGNRLFTLIGDNNRENNYNIIIRALKNIGIKAIMHGRNDIVVERNNQRLKVSGSAFNICGNVMKHHGTILHSVDKDKLTLYLNPSKLKLQTHGVQSIRSRIGNLIDFKHDITIDELDDSLIKSFSESIGSQPTIIDFDNDMILDKVTFDTIYQQLRNPHFIYNDNPISTITLEYKQPMGLFSFAITIDKGIVVACTVYSDCLDLQYTEKIQKQLDDIIPVSLVNIDMLPLFNSDRDDLLYILGRELTALRN